MLRTGEPDCQRPGARVRIQLVELSADVAVPGRGAQAHLDQPVVPTAQSCTGRSRRSTAGTHQTSSGALLMLHVAKCARSCNGLMLTTSMQMVEVACWWKPRWACQYPVHHEQRLFLG